MSKAVDDILGFLRGEMLSAEDQSELIQRLRDGEGDEHKPAGVWTMTTHTGAISAAENARAKIDWIHGPDVDPDNGLTITFYHGQMDGKPVIQIDGSADFRINVNDCPIWDQSTDFGYVMPEELRESKPADRTRRKVWVGTIEDPAGTNVEWFLTGKAASEDYRHVVEWWERFKDDVVWDTTVARWYVELPRRGMPRDEVDAWVEFVLTSREGGGIYRRRLDVKRFVAQPTDA